MAALLDNHIQQGNALDIDVRKIVWKRAVDMNDRQLRHIICGLGGKASGVPREDGFDITVASEIMAMAGKGPEDIVCAFGSLYQVGEIRAYFGRTT